MLVGEIMKNKGVGVVAVTPDQTMLEVLKLFRDNNIGFVVVSRASGKHVGTLSERDCCNAVAEYGAEATMMRAADIRTATLRPVRPGICCPSRWGS